MLGEFPIKKIRFRQNKFSVKKKGSETGRKNLNKVFLGKLKHLTSFSALENLLVP